MLDEIADLSPRMKREEAKTVRRSARNCAVDESPPTLVTLPSETLGHILSSLVSATIRLFSPEIKRELRHWALELAHTNVSSLTTFRKVIAAKNWKLARAMVYELYTTAAFGTIGRYDPST